MKKPYWYQVISHFVQHSYVRNGLTIPYLIGARTIIEPNESLLSIQEIICQITDFGGTILMCGNIGEFVIGLPRPEHEVPKCYCKYFHNLAATDNCLDEFDCESDWVSALKHAYKEHISNQKYSKIDGVWSHFSSEDLSRLRELKNHQLAS